jgi:hypothetical protein
VGTDTCHIPPNAPAVGRGMPCRATGRSRCSDHRLFRGSHQNQNPDFRHRSAPRTKSSSLFRAQTSAAFGVRLDFRFAAERRKNKRDNRSGSRISAPVANIGTHTDGHDWNLVHVSEAVVPGNCRVLDVDDDRRSPEICIRATGGMNDPKYGTFEGRHRGKQAQLYWQQLNDSARPCDRHSRTTAWSPI